MNRQSRGALIGMAAAVALCAAPVTAQAVQSARDLLTRASFYDSSKEAALARIEEAEAAADAALRRTPGDPEALLMQASALGYRAKLTGSRAEAIDARKRFEALAARDPHNPEAQMALGAWHVGAVNRLGGFVGRTVLGAQKKVGFDALDRSVALGGNHALYPGLAALLRLELDPADPRGRALAEIASRDATPTVLDRLMQRSCVAVLAQIRTGKPDTVKIMASRLLPFGKLD